MNSKIIVFYTLQDPEWWTRYSSQGNYSTEVPERSSYLWGNRLSYLYIFYSCSNFSIRMKNSNRMSLLIIIRVSMLIFSTKWPESDTSSLKRTWRIIRKKWKRYVSRFSKRRSSLASTSRRSPSSIMYALFAKAYYYNLLLNRSLYKYVVCCTSISNLFYFSFDQ